MIAIDTMKVLLSGSSGLVGSALGRSLTSDGHEVMRLVRRAASSADERTWDPARGEVAADAFDGIDAVVHLAGENIAARRWNPSQKERIRHSRVAGTRALCEALAGAPSVPETLVCASAIGIYGDRGGELLTEDSSHGSGFLAEVCADWEAATEPAAQAGVRVVLVRFGVVLSPDGGALAKMLLPFRMGAGGRVGGGAQLMSWIALDDAVRVLEHALAQGSLRGPVNAVSPHPVTNAQFTRALGRALRRPTIFPMPAAVARLAFGEMANELLLASQRVQPRALEQSGFTFEHPELEGALRHLLG